MKKFFAILILIWALATAPFMAVGAWKAWHREKELRAQGYENIGPFWFKKSTK